MTEIVDLIKVAAPLRALLVAAYEGEVASTPAGRHWLAGAIAALDVAGQSQAASPVSENAL
ncbi:MAG TPA: hypothetical protein VFO16_06755 [Pseudonocardiaceae bacterium]|nr:hypothetical protein [Pseudonocardiaceae bacterium]